MSDKKTVALLYGGRSVEHAVSVNSAKNIFEFLDKSLFEVLPIGISREGQWFLTPGVHKDIEQGKALGLILDPHSPGFLIMSSGDRIKADIVFPVLHGTDGEDGSIQGLIKTIGLPTVGTGVLGSAISMNKVITKRLLQDAGIPVSRFLAFTYEQRNGLSYEHIVQELGTPFMVKSASLGSSVGVSKVKNEADFMRAVEDAFMYDQQILMEEYIEGREIECAILGNNPAEASLPGEIIISDKYEFYTFDAKYVDGKAVQIEVPARIDGHSIDTIRSLALLTYKAMHCEDFARVDLFLTKGGQVFINEINTIPGFTNSSMYPMMWKERGINFTDLISKLIRHAFERHAQNKRLVHDFNSALKF